MEAPDNTIWFVEDEPNSVLTETFTELVLFNIIFTVSDVEVKFPKFIAAALADVRLITLGTVNEIVGAATVALELWALPLPK